MGGASEILRRYGPWGSLRLLRDWCFTRVLGLARGWDLRLVRLPCYLRGARGMRIGRRFTSGVGFRADVLPAGEDGDPRAVRLVIGDDVQVNDYVHIAAVHEVRIGDQVLIASRVFISDHGHGYYDDEHAALHEPPSVPPARRRLSTGRPVVIEDRVWLGEGVSVLPGAHIGAGAVIGAGSVVAGAIPPECVAVGVPARVVKRYDRAAGRWKRA
ncbi:MAG: acetyltransferase [Planctomycetota bacterium]